MPCGDYHFDFLDVFVMTAYTAAVVSAAVLALRGVVLCCRRGLGGDRRRSWSGYRAGSRLVQQKGNHRPCEIRYKPFMYLFVLYTH